MFQELPGEQQNSEIHESFVPAAPAPPAPGDNGQWQQMRDGRRKMLLEKSLAGWPHETEPLNVTQVFSVERNGLRLQAVDFTSQEPVRLRLYLVHRAGLDKPDGTVLTVLDQQGWTELLAMMRPAFETELAGESLPEADKTAFEQASRVLQSSAKAVAYVAPRGIGPTAWDQSERRQIQHRRRFYLLGQTLDAMRSAALGSDGVADASPVRAKQRRTR